MISNLPLRARANTECFAPRVLYRHLKFNLNLSLPPLKKKIINIPNKFSSFSYNDRASLFFPVICYKPAVEDMMAATAWCFSPNTFLVISRALGYILRGTGGWGDVKKKKNLVRRDSSSL